MSTSSGVPAGWYPDPANPGGQRFWDGNAWTHEVTGPADATPVQAVPAQAAAVQQPVQVQPVQQQPIQQVQQQPIQQVQQVQPTWAEQQQASAPAADPYATYAAVATAPAAAATVDQGLAQRAPAWDAMDAQAAPAGTGGSTALNKQARRVEGVFNFFALLVVVLALVAIAGAWFTALGTTTFPDDQKFVYAGLYTVGALLYAALLWAFLKAAAVVMGYVAERTGGHGQG